MVLCRQRALTAILSIFFMSTDEDGYSNSMSKKHAEEDGPVNKTIQVPCYTASSLLSAIQLSAKDVDAIVLDIEGFDNPVLQTFWEINGFQPKVICFEHDWDQDKGDRMLLSFLAQKGYDIFYDHANLWAILRGN